MNFKFLNAIIFLLMEFFSSSVALGNSPTYLFEMFLENKVNTFPAWIRSKKLDPSPINPSEFILFTSSLIPRYNFKIKDVQVFGHANATNNLTVSAEVDLNRQFLYVSYSTKGSLKFEGHYSINGTNSFPERPFVGEGLWSYALNGTLVEDFTYRFNIKPDGHLDISREIKQHSSLLFGDPRQKDLKFFGYLEENVDLLKTDKMRIKNKFQKAFDDQRIQNMSPDNPTAELMHKFLIEVFQNTPYSEIICDPTNPTSSPKPADVTTVDVPTTTEKAVTNEKPTNKPITSEALHGHSSHFIPSSYIYLLTFVSILYFQ